MKAHLVPLDGGPPIELVKDVTVVGRKETCDLRLKHPSVSKLHVLLIKTDGVVLFRDLGSTNGTKVNGQRVRSGALLPNDKLSVAACKFRVRMAGNGAPATPGEHTEMLDVAALQSPEVQAIRGEAGRRASAANPAAPPEVPAEQSPLLKDLSVDLPALPASESAPIRGLFQD